MVNESGPFNVLSRLRTKAGAENNDGEVVPWDEATETGKLLQCPYCLSLWFALVLFLLSKISPRLYEVIAMALCGSAATALIEDLHEL